MKKFVVVILLLMPIFLMISISFAGKIYSNLVYIEVDSVQIVDELENPITQTIKIAKDEVYQIKTKVLPELANNKKVLFSSLNPTVASVDADGRVVGLEFGTAAIMVETVDGHKTASVNIRVTNEKVERIELNFESKQLVLYQSFQLIATIYPETAINKNVTWTSSNPSIVTVDANGNLKALQITDENIFVLISATTEDGNKTAYCSVSVIDYRLAFTPQLEGKPSYTASTQTLDLLSLITYNPNYVNPNNIVFSVVSGASFATLNGSILTFNTTGKMINIKASTTDGQYETTMWFRYITQ